MKGVKKFLWFLYKCFAFYTLLIYILILWIPSDSWLAGFMMMSFPAVVLIHLISLPIWFVIERKKALLPLFLLFLGGIFLSRTYAFGPDKKKSDQGGETFSVMSYNVHTFDRVSNLQEDGVRDGIDDMKNWIADSDADVLCLPEYFHDHSSLFNASEVFAKKGLKNSVYYKEKWNEKRYWGLALFTRFPIIASRDTVFESQNGMIQADLKIKGDTVRIIGLHLYSMTLKLSTLVRQKKMEGVAKESKSTLGRMKTGFIRRTSELEALEEWIKASPYPVIICGDFNEVPYGYVYGRLRKTLHNSFEGAGSGFGFTFNHLPYFIRIDHQFYSPGKFNLLDFTTFNKIRYSDHYPIMGTYQIAH
jgi:endonuclease/exonuclease/phosphatase family metal-dependent hydrolase